MNTKFHFLCGNFSDYNFIYAIKFGSHPWHYFDATDAISSVHGALSKELDSTIATLDGMSTIEVPLDNALSRIYFNSGKFIFKSKILKTFRQLIDTQKSEGSSSTVPEPSKKESSGEKKKAKVLDQMAFIYGQTNPITFLNEFERCKEFKNERDKMFKLRNIVDEPHKAEFSEICFTSDWSNMRQVFIKKYSATFTENKKRETNIDFNEEISLRKFVENKLRGLSMYTSLQLVHQMEVILMELPNEISNMFLINEKIFCSKLEILEFCDSIQDFAQKLKKTVQSPTRVCYGIQQKGLDMGSESEWHSDLEQVNTSRSTIGKVRGTGRSSRIQNQESDRESTEIDLSNTDDSFQMFPSDNDTSDSTSAHNSPKRVCKKNAGKVAKRGRRKNLITITEEGF